MIPSPRRCIVCGGVPSEDTVAGGLALRRCGGCGLAWRRGFPDDAALAALYGDDYFERWGIDSPESRAAVRAMKEASHRPFVEALRAHRTDGRLLDLGCALGFLLGVAREAGFEAYGLDLNEAAVADARREFGDRVHAGRLDDAAFPGVRFDAITLIDVLEHVPDPEALLETLAARLAPDGVIAAVLPDAGSVTARLFGRRWPHYNPEHLFYWSAGNLRTFLEERGWRIRTLRRGILKTYTARYLDHYARQMGRTPPPGLGALGNLRLRLPTGEMLVIAQAPRRESAADQDSTRTIS